MNDIVVKSNLKEMKQNLEGKKRDELREGNSLGVPKSTVLVGKPGKKNAKGVAERKKRNRHSKRAL